MCSDHGLLKLALLGSAALVSLSGCNTMNSHIGEEDPLFGESVKYDVALQTINPDPVYPPSAAQPGGRGDKGARAVLRYRTDTVKPVEQQQTSGGGSR